MRIVLLAPYGALHAEAGLMYLLASYLGDGAVAQLLCNGVFSLCDRDVEAGKWRTLTHCLSCMGEQRALAKRAGLQVLELSRFLQVDDVLRSKEWLNSLKASALPTAMFEGVSVFDLCAGSFRVRFGMDAPNWSDPEKEPIIRRYMLAAARMYLATGRLLEEIASDYALVAGGRDFITRAFVHGAAARKLPVGVFLWEIGNRRLSVLDSRSEEVFTCDIVVQDLFSLRTEMATWPAEIKDVVTRLVSFLQFETGQLSLPFAASPSNEGRCVRR